MDDLLPEEIGNIRNSVNRFMENEVNPVMDEIERKGQCPRNLFRKAGDAGFYRVVFPESVGGTNFGYVAAAAVSEEFARNDVRFAACNNQHCQQRRRQEPPSEIRFPYVVVLLRR